MTSIVFFILVILIVYFSIRKPKNEVKDDLVADLLDKPINDLLDIVSEQIEVISNIEDKDTKARKFDVLIRTLRYMESMENRKAINDKSFGTLYFIRTAIIDVEIAVKFADKRVENSKKGKIFDSAIKNILTLLLADDEVINMGRNLIESMPDWFYCDELTLLYVDSIVGMGYDYPSQLLLLPSEYDRKIFTSKQYSNLTELTKEIAAKYLTETFSLFRTIALSDKSYLTKDKGVQLVAAYNVINRLVIEHFSEGQELIFPDIDELSFDKAVEKFCFSGVAEQEQNHFIYFLMKHKKFNVDNHHFPKCKEVFFKSFNHFMEIKKFHDLSNHLKKPRNMSYIEIEDIDLMTGQQFEHLVAKLLLNLGYETEVTKSSGDQGIDVIASKDGNKLGIQAKCYSSSVGNTAIQEAVAGKAHYKLDRVMVVTNHFFTESAKQLAKSNGVILWDREILKEKLSSCLISKV